MRQVFVSVPEARSDDVVEVLQTSCALKNVTRFTQDGISTIMAIMSDEVVGMVMYNLDLIGVGVAFGKISVVPVVVTKPLPKAGAMTAAATKAKEWRETASFSLGKGKSPHTLIGDITTTLDEVLSMKISRLAIEEIYSVVSEGAALTWDYALFIIIAGWIAAVGLATNNNIMIVASMLVSPLMGPILGFTLGTAILDKALMVKSLKAFFVGTLITFLTGFIIGLILSGWPEVILNFNWPTGEMSTRGSKANLLVGLFFAIPSGAGVALSATQGGVNPLVGVAIAASLLPPVVNTGMCLAYAAAGAERHSRQYPELGLTSSAFTDIAGISFSLFLVNIACIYVVCLLLFLAKKIKPVRRQLSRYTDLPKITPHANKDMDVDPHSPAADFKPSDHHAPIHYPSAPAAMGATASVTTTALTTAALAPSHSRPGVGDVTGKAGTALLATESAMELSPRASMSHTGSRGDTAYEQPMLGRDADVMSESTRAPSTVATRGPAPCTSAASAGSLGAIPGASSASGTAALQARGSESGATATSDGVFSLHLNDSLLDMWAERVAPTASLAVMASMTNQAALRQEFGGSGGQGHVSAAVEQWVCDQQHMTEMRGRWKQMLEDYAEKEVAAAAARKGKKPAQSRYLKALAKLEGMDGEFQKFLGKLRSKVVANLLATDPKADTARVDMDEAAPTSAVGVADRPPAEEGADRPSAASRSSNGGVGAGGPDGGSLGNEQEGAGGEEAAEDLGADRVPGARLAPGEGWELLRQTVLADKK